MRCKILSDDEKTGKELNTVRTSHLTHLSLNDNPLEIFNSLWIKQLLGCNSALTYLDLTHVNLTDDVCFELNRANTHFTLTFHYCFTVCVPALISCIDKNRTLRYFHIGFCYNKLIPTVFLDKVAVPLLKNQTLSRLHFGQTFLHHLKHMNDKTIAINLLNKPYFKIDDSPT